jgi:hypothetical protein
MTEISCRIGALSNLPHTNSFVLYGVNVMQSQITRTFEKKLTVPVALSLCDEVNKNYKVINISALPLFS